VAKGFDLVPENPNEWKGEVYRTYPFNGTEKIFGDTRFKVINFTNAGSITIINDRNVERIFTFYLFKHNNCYRTDIIINPYSGHYYGVAANDHATYSSYNDTMVSYMNRCFYYIMKATYNVELTIHEIEFGYDKLFLSSDTELNYTSIPNYIADATLTSTNALFIKWVTDSSTEKGIARFQFNTNEETGEFMKIYGNSIFKYINYNNTDDTDKERYEKIINSYGLLVAVMVSIWVIMIIIIVTLCLTKSACLTPRFSSRFEELQVELDEIKRMKIMRMNPNQYPRQETSPYGNISPYDQISRATININ
jgi:hypothetical protein